MNSRHTDGNPYDYFQPDRGPSHIRSLDNLPIGTRFIQVHEHLSQSSSEHVLVGQSYCNAGGIYVIPSIYHHDRPHELTGFTTISLLSSGIAPLPHSPLEYHQNNWLKRVDAPPMPVEEIKQHLTEMLTWFKNPESIAEVERCLAALPR